ncbi:MAG: 3-phosphoserine/phosphohydroxythreonine transaminase [Burkholderiales bacterium]|jgi:phosphoserine aminotransferase
MTTTTLAKRIHNFGAGPAALPLPVLERVQAELLDYAGTGMSVLEMSHRSAAFEGIIQKAEEDLRALAGLGSEHVVLFLQGGASLQFSMLPANLRAASASADYVITGHWAKAAVKEAEKSGRARVAGTTEATAFDRVPAAGELQLDPQAAYLHFTSNNTIYGTQWATAPVPPKGVPLVCDMSSDALSRPLDIAQYGLVYAGAQKNLGPAGVTLVVMRRELLERVPAGLPAVLDYKLMAENRSLYNTPPCFAIYVTGLVLAWLREQGGLAAAGERNAAKAALVYEAIDGSDGFYSGHAQPGSRSAMNITFRLKDAAAEKAFLADAQAEGLDGLKGHRSVGGVRASLYNACPRESAAALASFMGEFRRRRG